MTSTGGWIEPNDEVFKKWEVIKEQRRSNFAKFRSLMNASTLFIEYLDEVEKTRPLVDADYEIFYRIEALKKTVTDAIDSDNLGSGCIPLARMLSERLKERIAEEDAKLK